MPTTRTVLEALNEAGNNGMLSRDIAGLFPDADPRSSLSRADMYLNRALRAGRVRRGGKEPSRGPTGQRSRCCRWYITSGGVEYLTPKPLPRVTRLDEPPNPRRVLELLKEAGEEGMLGAVLARYFTISDPLLPSMSAKKMSVPSQNLQRRLAWMNQILGRFLRHGWVRRGDPEPTPYYHNVPVYRWFITGDGAEYLAAGMSAGIHAVRIAEARRVAEQRHQENKLQNDLITQAYLDYDPRTVRKCEREKAIRELRAAGCTLDAIGGVFGVTRERIRQIVNGYKASPCTCPRCTDGKRVEAGDGEAAG